MYGEDPDGRYHVSNDTVASKCDNVLTTSTYIRADGLPSAMH